jgi:hypothetical protein
VWVIRHPLLLVTSGGALVAVLSAATSWCWRIIIASFKHPGLEACRCEDARERMRPSSLFGHSNEDMGLRRRSFWSRDVGADMGWKSERWWEKDKCDLCFLPTDTVHGTPASLAAD